MYFSLVAAVVGVGLSIVAFFSRRERARSLIVGDVYKMERVIIYTSLFVCVAMMAVAISLIVHDAYGDAHGSDADVPASVGLLAAICALVWSAYEVRTEAACIRFGLMARKSLPYLQVREILDIRNQGSPRAVLITADGRKFKIWSNLIGYYDLVDKLKSRCSMASYRLIGSQ